MNPGVVVASILIILLGGVVASGALSSGLNITPLCIVGSGDRITMPTSITVPFNSQYSVTGRLTDKGSAPLPGVILYWEVSTSSGQTSLTDPTGTFTAQIPGLLTGTYTLVMSEDPGFGSTCSTGAARATATYTVASGVFLYQLTITVSASSAPVVGATVGATASGLLAATGTTEQDGTVVFQLQSGTYQVTAEFTGYQTGTASVTISGASKGATITLIKSVYYGNAQFSFYDSVTKVAIPGFQVSVTGTSDSATTGSNGTVWFKLPLGFYTATITNSPAYGSNTRLITFNLTIAGWQKWTFWIPPSFGSIVFKAGTTGALLPGVRVTIASIGFVQTTGTNGSVEFMAPVGTYSFAYTCADPFVCSPGTGSIILTASSTTTLFITLTASGGSQSNTCGVSQPSDTSIQVLVYSNKDDSPVIGAVVSGGGVVTSTDSTGAACLQNLGVPGGNILNGYHGKITVEVAGAGYNSQNVSVPVVAGDSFQQAVFLNPSSQPTTSDTYLGLAIIAVGVVVMAFGLALRRKP